MRRKEEREMAVVKIKGDIVPNKDKWIYDWLGWEATCPEDIESVIAGMSPGEELEVHINSGGGSVWAGQEIYTMLKRRTDVVIEIQSMAGSAAGVVAMAGKNRISPIGMIMIHNVSMSGASGDYHAMEKNVEILKQMNAAMAEAYTEKSGMELKEVLKLMDRETWLTANQCLEYGFVDEIMTDRVSFTNAVQGMRLTEEIRKQVMEEKNKKEELIKDLDMYGV